MVKNKILRRHGVSVDYLQVSIKYIFCSVSHQYCAIIHFKTPISVFSCYTLYICGNSSSRFTLIVYRDGGSAMEMGNILLHVPYTSSVSVYVNYSLHAIMYIII